VACLPVPRAYVFPSFPLFAWWSPLHFFVKHFVKHFVFKFMKAETFKIKTPSLAGRPCYCNKPQPALLCRCRPPRGTWRADFVPWRFLSLCTTARTCVSCCSSCNPFRRYKCLTFRRCPPFPPWRHPFYMKWEVFLVMAPSPPSYCFLCSSCIALPKCFAP
jgi:hypothetical protein